MKKEEHLNRLLKLGDMSPRVVETKDKYGRTVYVPWTPIKEGAWCADYPAALSLLTDMVSGKQN